MLPHRLQNIRVEQNVCTANKIERDGERSVGYLQVSKSTCNTDRRIASGLRKNIPPAVSQATQKTLETDDRYSRELLDLVGDTA